MIKFINEQTLGFANKFKIPTLLGLTIILVGLISGVYLVVRDQTYLSQAAPNLTPQNITFTNISDNSVVISWQTNSPATSFITFGQNNPSEQTALDDKDNNAPKSYLIHYLTLKNLLPKTSYQFKIISGKLTSDILKFETAAPLTNQTGFTPVIGSVLDGNVPLDSGVAHLSIEGAAPQSALIKEGNFLIPLVELRKADLSDVYQLTEGAIAKLTIRSAKGEASVSFNLKTNSVPLPPIRLGQNNDLTTPEIPPTSVPELNFYDLNNDGITNTADYAFILRNQGKQPENEQDPKQKADINQDGAIDQTDLELMSQKLKELSSQ